MWKITKYMAPTNGFTADTLRFVPNFRELKMSWTANELISEGMEKFVEEYLPRIRANNPQVKYSLHRTYTLCDPFLTGVYTWERKKKFRCDFKHETQILAFAEEMSVGGDFRPGRRRRVTPVLPRGQELWNIETRGHDVFKVHSKWKADPVDPDVPTSANHPHLIIRKMMRKGGQFF